MTSRSSDLHHTTSLKKTIHQYLKHQTRHELRKAHVKLPQKTNIAT